MYKKLQSQEFIQQNKAQNYFMRNDYNLTKSSHFEPIGKLRFMSARKLNDQQQNCEGRYHMQMYENDTPQIQPTHLKQKTNAMTESLTYHIKQIHMKQNQIQHSPKTSLKSPPRKILKTMKSINKKISLKKQEQINGKTHIKTERNAPFNCKSIFVKVSKDDDYFYESSVPQNVQKYHENIHNSNKNKYSRENLQLLNQKLRAQRSLKKFNTQSVNFRIQNSLQPTKKAKTQDVKSKSISIKLKTSVCEHKNYNNGIATEKQIPKTSREKFTTKIKNKRIDDNPHVFANLLKKKINTLSKVQMYDYVNALVRKLNHRIA